MPNNQKCNRKLFKLTNAHQPKSLTTEMLATYTVLSLGSGGLGKDSLIEHLTSFFSAHSNPEGTFPNVDTIVVNAELTVAQCEAIENVLFSLPKWKTFLLETAQDKIEFAPAVATKVKNNISNILQVEPPSAQINSGKRKRADSSNGDKRQRTSEEPQRILPSLSIFYAQPGLPSFYPQSGQPPFRPQ